MPRAIWNGQVIAESEAVEDLAGTAYFPPAALKPEFFRDSDHTSVCGWKGTANYFSINAGGAINTDAAFYYPEPLEAAAAIRDRIAFWKGVEVMDL